MSGRRADDFHLAFTRKASVEIGGYTVAPLPQRQANDFHQGDAVSG